jgi:peptidoglycan/LPS O-acetylase OafA/YrhL
LKHAAVAPKGGRLGFLDAVRGVAALAVAAGHGAELLFPGYLRFEGDWLSAGRAGVCAFFLVSGFVIPISLERAKDGLRGFAIGRVFRLYPLYWTSLFAVLAVARFKAGALPTDFAADRPWAAVVNLSMAQEYFRVPHAIGLYYTLTIELLWYVACAVLFTVGLLRRTPLLTAAALGGLLVISVGVPVVADRHVPFASGFYLVTMLVGTCFARHAAGTMSTRALGLVVAGAGVVAAAGSWANYVHVPPPIDPHGVLGLTGALSSWGIAYAVFALGYRLRATTFPVVLTFLGVVSYSVYLVHPVLLPFVLGAGRAWVRLGALLVATVVVATVTQRLVELPGQALGKRVRATFAAP